MPSVLKPLDAWGAFRVGSRPAAVAALLYERSGELYLPFLVANEQAFSKGVARLEINVWGLPYALAPFRYQVKCLQLLREKFAALDTADRAALKPVLERTGCWQYLQSPA